MSQSNPTPRPQEEEIDLREELQVYLQQWPLFIVGVIICVAVAFLYLKYTTPIYKTVATIIIKDDEENGMPSELSAFEDMGLLGGMGTSAIENEIGILRSKRLMTNVAEDLDLNIQYYLKETVPPKELFADKPFNVQILEFNSEKYMELAEAEKLHPFFFNITSNSTFTIEDRETGWSKEQNFGKAFKLPFAEILVTPNFSEVSALDEIFKESSIEVAFTTIDDAAAKYRALLQVNLTDENADLIELGLEDPVRSKAQQILNQLIHQYNQEAIADKNLVSLNTANFIEERLKIITEELDSVETGKEQFKKENELTDIQAESQLFIENASEFRKRQLEVETQLELANTMIDYLKSDDDGLLPSNLGFKEEGVATIIQSYNQMVLERDRILAGSTEENPVIINLNDQIQQIKANVLQSLNNLRTSLIIAQNDLNAQEAKINAQIARVPAKEKEFRNIERQQNIKEALYLYLLQKREETSLSLAVTAPKAKIVDSAYSSNEPVSPKKKIIFLAALIIGLLIPFLYIYIRNLLNNKVQGRSDMETELKDIPLVGEIPKIAKNQQELIEGNDRSVLAESFRILHTNLQYLLVNAGKKPGGNTIFVTSTIKGEGKTFVAFNLAITLAHADKKVLIVGADLRNPQLQRFEAGARNHLGVSDYLINKSLGLEKVVQRSELHANLDILVSGSIPPNPSELWRQERAATLFAALEAEYDYVIVDTAPAMLVTDTFLINKYADLTLYLVRAGYTAKKLLNFPIEAKKEGKLHDVGYVINDVEANHFGYGNKYGYYYAYGEEQPGFWERIKKRASFW